MQLVMCQNEESGLKTTFDVNLFRKYSQYIINIEHITEDVFQVYLND